MVAGMRELKSVATIFKEALYVLYALLIKEEKFKVEKGFSKSVN